MRILKFKVVCPKDNLVHSIIDYVDGLLENLRNQSWHPERITRVWILFF